LIFFTNSSIWTRTWTRNAANSLDGAGADFASLPVSLKFSFHRFEQ
jgi:hypothetical protein